MHPPFGPAFRPLRAIQSGDFSKRCPRCKRPETARPTEVAQRRTSERLSWAQVEDRRSKGREELPCCERWTPLHAAHFELGAWCCESVDIEGPKKNVGHRVRHLSPASPPLRRSPSGRGASPLPTGDLRARAPGWREARPWRAGGLGIGSGSCAPRSLWTSRLLSPRTVGCAIGRAARFLVWSAARSEIASAPASAALGAPMLESR